MTNDMISDLLIYVGTFSKQMKKWENTGLIFVFSRLFGVLVPGPAHDTGDMSNGVDSGR